MSSNLAARISELKHLADRISKAADLILRNCASSTHTGDKFVTLLDVASLNAGASAFALESLHLDFLSDRIRDRSPLTAVAALVQSVHPRSTHPPPSSSFFPQDSAARVFTTSPDPISPPPIYRPIPSFVLPPLGNTQFPHDDLSDYSDFDDVEPDYHRDRVSAITRRTREEEEEPAGRATGTAPAENDDDIPDRRTSQSSLDSDSSKSKGESKPKEPPQAGSTSPLLLLQLTSPVSIYELVDDDSKPDTRGGVKRKREPDLESTDDTPESSKKIKKS